MEVIDEVELWLLLRTFFEYKFGESNCALELAGSEPLAHVIERIWSDFRLTRLFHATTPAGGWETWRQLTPERPEWARIVTWVSQSKQWTRWTDDEKVHYLRLLALPFVIHPDFMKLLLDPLK